MRLIALETDDQALDLCRQLIGIAYRPPRPVSQGLQPVLLVAVEDFVAGLARDAELATDIRHRLAIQKPSDKPQAFIHDRTLFPRHQHLPPKKAKGVTHVSGTICHLCLRPLTGFFEPTNLSEYRRQQ